MKLVEKLWSKTWDSVLFGPKHFDGFEEKTFSIGLETYSECAESRRGWRWSVPSTRIETNIRRILRNSLKIPQEIDFGKASKVTRNYSAAFELYAISFQSDIFSFSKFGCVHRFSPDWGARFVGAADAILKLQFIIRARRGRDISQARLDMIGSYVAETAAWTQT